MIRLVGSSGGIDRANLVATTTSARWALKNGARNRSFSPAP
jgi:hypothetical protein